MKSCNAGYNPSISHFEVGCVPLALETVNVELPERMHESFAELSSAILSVFPEGHVALGGGTVLEARWGHRLSTDLDFFIANDLLRVAYAKKGRHLYAMLHDAIREVGASIDTDRLNLGARSLFMEGRCSDGTPWSIADMHYSDPRVPMLETINGTAIRAATVTETLMGKIAGRAYVADKRQGEGKEPIPIRDCYDICVSAALAPGPLAGVLEVMPPDATDRIATNFRNAPHDLDRRDSKPIVAPKWVVPFPGIASRIGDAVSARDIGLLPVAVPADQSEDCANDGLGGTKPSKPRLGRGPSP